MLAIALVPVLAVVFFGRSCAPVPEPQTAQFEDPLIQAVIDTTGAQMAEIVGYVVDFAGPDESTPPAQRPYIELVAMREGGLYRSSTTKSSGWGPPLASGETPVPRLEPEPAEEAGAREDAVAGALNLLTEQEPRYMDGEGVVYGYAISLVYADGRKSLAIVSPDGKQIDQDAELTPWP